MVFLESGLVCFISCHAIVQAVDQCLLGLKTILLGGLIKDFGLSQLTIQFFVFYQIAVVACSYKFLATVISFQIVLGFNLIFVVKTGFKSAVLSLFAEFG